MGFKLFRMNICASVDSGGVPEGRHTSAAAGRGKTWWASIFVGRAATAGGLRSGRLNEIIITYLGNLSISNYKCFRCYGIEDGKVETRNVKVETGRAERVKPRTLCKTNLKGCATQEHLSALRVVHPPNIVLTDVFTSAIVSHGFRVGRGKEPSESR